MIKLNFNDRKYYLCFDKNAKKNLDIYLAASNGILTKITADEDNLKYNEIAVINNGELQGVEDSLIKAGVIGKFPKRKINYGYTNFNVYSLISRALKEANIQMILESNSKKKAVI